MPPDLTDDDKAILIELLRETIERDRYPLSPWVQSFKAIVEKLDPKPAAEPYPARRPSVRPSADASVSCGPSVTTH